MILSRLPAPPDELDCQQCPRKHGHEGERGQHLGSFRAQQRRLRTKRFEQAVVGLADERTGTQPLLREPGRYLAGSLIVDLEVLHVSDGNAEMAGNLPLAGKLGAARRVDTAQAGTFWQAPSVGCLWWCKTISDTPVVEASKTSPGISSWRARRARGLSTPTMSRLSQGPGPFSGKS